MSIKKLYYYWFYKYYSFLERYDQTRWLSQTKAIIIMGVLEIFFIISIINYIEILTFNNSDKLEKGPFFIFVATFIVLMINLGAFNGEEWKDYVNEFDTWDVSKNKRGTWIVLLITIMTFANFIYSSTLIRELKGWPV